MYKLHSFRLTILAIKMFLPSRYLLLRAFSALYGKYRSCLLIERNKILCNKLFLYISRRRDRYEAAAIKSPFMASFQGGSNDDDEMTFCTNFHFFKPQSAN